MRRIYAKLMVVVISAICLFLAIDYNMNGELQAGSVKGTQAALTSYKDRDLNSEISLGVSWNLIYVDPNTGVGLFKPDATSSNNTPLEWNTNCVATANCLNPNAYNNGPVGTQFNNSVDISGFPGSRNFGLTKTDYDNVVAANGNANVFINIDPSAKVPYWLGTGASTTTVWGVDGSNGNLVQLNPGTKRMVVGFRRFSLQLATLTASKPTFVMREGNYSGALPNFTLSNFTLDTAGTSINYIVKSGDPGGVFKVNSGNSTKQTSLQLVNGQTSLNSLVADRSGANVSAKTYPIVVAVDEWKLTTQQPTPATVNIKVKPPFPTNANITWTATSGFNFTNIPKDTAINTVVAKISLNNYTSDPKTTVTYSTSNTSSTDPFKINANGDVVVQRALNSSETFSKDVKVTLVDSELDNLSINVQTKNLTAPTNLEIGVGKLLVPSFTETTNSDGSKITFRKDEENVKKGAIIGTLSSSDNTGDVTYNIDAVNSSKFEVVMDADNVNGKLVASNALQAGFYKIEITASDDLFNKPLIVEFTVQQPHKEITDFNFTQTAGLRVGYPTVDIGKSAGTLSAKGGGVLSYALTAGGSDNGFFTISGTSVLIDKAVTDTTYNLEVEISDAGTGKKKIETFSVVIAGQFAAVTDITLTPDGVWEYKNNFTTANKRLGKFSATGGTAGFTYAFKTDANLGAQNANFSIKGNELWVGVADLVAGIHKIHVEVTDVNNQTYVEALVLTVDKTKQTFTINNSNLADIPLSDSTMQITLDNGQISTVATTYEITAGKGTVANIVGDTVTFLSAGSFTVVATNGGDSNYKPYTSPDKTFVITKSKITLEAADKAMLIGETLPVNQLLLVSGNVANNDLTRIGTPAYTYYDSSGSVVAPSDLTSTGTYKIVPSLNENAEMKKYDITYSDKGDLTIGQDAPDENYYSIAPSVNSAGWYKGDPSTKSVVVTSLGYNGYTMISGDGGATFSASNAITLTQEKTHELDIVLKKASGAITSSKQAEIKLDSTAPSATSIQYQAINQSTFAQVLSALSFNQIFAEDQRLTFSATDTGGSTLDCFEYVLTTYDANGTAISVGNPIKVSASNPTLDIISDNRYSIEVKAIDKAGNEGLKTNETILLDKGEIQIGMSAQAGSASYDGTAWTDKDIEITLSSTGALELKEYMVKEGNGAYVSVTQNPYIINQDKNDVEYLFKAVSLNGKESDPVSIQGKRDSVTPAFRVDTTVNGVKYNSGDATADDILFTFVKDTGNVNISPVTYYYATSNIAVGDNGWTPILSNATTKLIDYNTTDTFYFKAVSDAGVSSQIIQGPTLLRFKAGASNINVSSTFNGNSATPYDGNWTKEDVVFTLQNGIDDITKIKTYQYTTTVNNALDGSEVWKDLKEKSAGSLVNNQLSIQASSEENYFFRVQVLDTLAVYSTTSKYPVKVDKTAPTAPTIAYTPHTRSGFQLFLNSITFDKVFAASQQVSFSSSDLGGSQLKSFTYVLTEIDEAGTALPNPITSTVTINDPTFLLDEDSRYIIEVKAVDVAGNESSLTSKKVLLDTSEPSVSVTATLGSLTGSVYDGTTWTFEDIYLDFQTDASLGAKKFQYKTGNDPYQDVVMPMIISSDQDEVYTFKAISHSEQESSELILPIKRDSVTPAFHVEATSNGNPYVDNTPTNQDVLFTMSKNDGNLNISNVSYYYATSPLGVNDAGWVKIENNGSTLVIDETTQDTYYFKAVSEAGLSSIVMKAATLNIVKEAGTNIEITRNINGDPSSSYTGSWTNQSVVVSLANGMADLTMIKGYQYCELSIDETPDVSTIWYDMPEKSASSSVYNQITISSSKQKDYFYRVIANGTGSAYAQTSKSPIRIDTQNPNTPTVAYQPGIEVGDSDEYRKSYDQNQTATFSGTDLGGSGIKAYRYVIETLNAQDEVLSNSGDIDVLVANPVLQLTMGKIYRVSIRSIDNTGNISDPIVHTLDMLGSGRLDKVEDVDSGVVVEGKDNTTFDKDTIVEVKLITEEVEVDDLGKLNEQLAKLSKLPKESEIKEVYEIKLLVNGVEVVSPGRVKIKIPLTKELLELENRRVVYIDDDGVVSLMTSYEDGTHIIFETTHFSKYAITGKKKEPSDLNYDSDGDGFPDVNIDLDGDGNADLNIDTDNDKSPDINIDTDGDSKADFNLDNKGNRKPYINIGTVIKPWKPNFCKELPDTEIKGYCTNNTLVPYLNLDTNDDGYPDVNIDLDGDGNPELNIDVDQDNIPDVNIDGAGNGKATINIDKDGDGTPEENIVDVTSWNPSYIVNLGDFSYGTMPISNPNDPSPPIKVPNLPSNDTNVGGAQDVVKPNYNTSVGGAYTGDSTSLILWSIFALASGLGCITVFKRRKM